MTLQEKVYAVLEEELDYERGGHERYTRITAAVLALPELRGLAEGKRMLVPTDYITRLDDLFHDTFKSSAPPEIHIRASGLLAVAWCEVRDFTRALAAAVAAPGTGD